MTLSIRNLSFRTRFLLLLSIMILLIGLVAVFFVLTLNSSENYKKYSSQVDKLTIQYLELRRFEQQFLLRYKDDKTFFTTGQNTYIRKHADAANKFDLTIGNIIQSEITKDLNINENYEAIRDYKNNYRKIFVQLVETIFKRGSDETGVIGEMKKASENALTEAPNDAAKKHILVMQKLSDSYLLNKREETYDEFIFKFRELYYNLMNTNQDSLMTDYEDDSEIKSNSLISTNFADQINAYKQYFMSLRKIDEKLGFDFRDGLKGKLRNEIHKINPEIDLINKQIKSTYQVQIRDAKNSTYIFLLIISIIIILLIWIFSVSVSVPLNKLYAYVEPLSKGILPNQIELTKGKDEAAKMQNVINKLIESLKKTTDFAITLGEGVFNTDYTPLSENDALGNALLDMRRNLNQAAIEDKRRKREDDTRKWTNEGIAKFNDILRQNPDDIEQLSGHLIRELVNYLDANQGAMYIYNDGENEEEKYLELTSAYAYGKEKKRRNKIYPGEGLLGTAAIEKESIYMTDIPDSYLNITSGLGSANPRSLLIVPMKVEEDVLGVIEIASFSEFKSHQISFTEDVADNIAASLSMTKINLRTSKLLKQSQTQAEQMSLQEKEMRQNFEELKETQEESARREAEMASILSAIDSSSLVLDISNNGNITFANRGMLELLEVPEAQIIGLQHNEFIQIRSAKEYNDLWNKLRNGEHIRRIENIKMNNKEVWLSIVYAPIKDEAEKIMNIMALGTDITEPKLLEFEMKRQAEVLSVQEEELRKNLQELHTTQKEMNEKQAMLESANTKLKKNEKALKTSVKKSEKQETLLKQKVNELNLVQEHLQQQHNNLIYTNKELEQKEKEIRDRFDAVDENNLVAEYLPNGTLIKANATFLKTFGYSLKEIKGKHQRMFIPEKIRKTPDYKKLWTKLRRGEKINTECKRVDKNKKLYFFKTIYSPILNLENKPIKILEILTDITVQKSTESLLVSRNENINTTAVVVEFDTNINIIKANDNFSKAIGYTADELQGKPHSIFVEAENRDSERYIRFKRELKRGNTVSNTFLFMGKNKNVVYLKGSYSGVKDPSGKVKSIIFSGFDTTELELLKQKYNLN